MVGRVPCIVALSLAAGCAVPDGPVVAHRSVLDVATRGLVLHGEGRTGHAGMRHTNCPFETESGSVTGDYDLPDDDETVEDEGEDEEHGEETVLLTQPGRIHLLNKRTGDYQVESLDVPGVVTGRFSAEGLVALVDLPSGCAVRWLDLDVEQPVDCGGSLAVDPATGTAYLAQGGVEIVSPDDRSEAEADGDLSAWDPATHTLYLATAGDSTVRALEADGSLRWEVEVDGPIHAIEHAGRREAVVVSWERANGTGALDWLDAWTGERRTGVDTPAPAPAVESSPSGDVVALILSSQAHFYEVRWDGSPDGAAP